MYLALTNNFSCLRVSGCHNTFKYWGCTLKNRVQMPMYKGL